MSVPAHSFHIGNKAAMGPEIATSQLRSSRSLSAKDAPKHTWLDAWADPVAGLKAFSYCIHTCNLYGDGDWRLIVADADRKIKVEICECPA
jgi:Bardet-Biedl syndrome 1 protein